MKKKLIKNLSLLIIICSSLTLLSCSNTSKKITISENTEDMKQIANDISSKFEVIILNDTVEQDSHYYFPENINTTINDKSISFPIKWDYAQADTSTPGTFEYYGFNEEYGRKVQMNLTVSEVIYSKQIGCIKNIYTANGKTYIDVDLVEFYLGKELALNEALKDNLDLPVNENGDPYVPDGYYIRNNYDTITTYEISNDCSFQLLHHDLTDIGYNIPAPPNSSITEIVSFDDFRNYIDLRTPMNIGDIDISEDKPITQRETLCWIELKNDVAYSIYRQYTP